MSFITLKSFKSSAALYILADGSSGFPASKDRYHLYVSLACPWAHRTLIVRSLKGLTDIISVSVVDWMLGDKGWKFTDQVTWISDAPELLTSLQAICFSKFLYN